MRVVGRWLTKVIGDVHRWRHSKGGREGPGWCDDVCVGYRGGWSLVTSRKVHWQLLVCSTKIVLIVSTGFSSIIDTSRIVGLYGAQPMTWRVCPSVCPIMRPQPWRAAGLWLSAMCTPPASLLHWSHTARHSAAVSRLRLRSWRQTCFCRQ